MDSVDYLQFVNGNAQRSDQGVASLMQALQYRQQKEQQAQQMQRQQEQDAQAKQLHDLQVAKLQEEQQYQQGLKAAMASPPTTSTLTQATPQPLPSLASLGINTPDYVPPPSAAPDDAAQSDIAGLQSQVDKYPGLAALSGTDKRLAEMKAASPRQMVASTGSLAGLLASPEPARPSLGSAPEFGAQPPQVQAPMLPGVSVSTETQSPYQAGAEYAAKNGRTEEATKYINLNEEMAKRAAQERAYGSPEKAAQMEVDADKMKKAAMTFTELKKAGGMQYAIAASKQYPDLFGKIDLTKLSDKGNINTYDLPNGQQVVWSDDNPGVIHLSAAPPHDKEVETWGPAYETSVGGKKAMVQKSNRGQIRPVIQDTSTTVKVSTNGGGDDDDVAAWAKAVSEGRAALSDVPNRGTVRSRVVKMIEGSGGADYAGKKADNTAYSANLTQLNKQLGSMGSFVKNLDKQVGRVEQISKELSTFDTRLLNVPLRAVRGRIAGSPQQAKYDMYLAEIESEIGKLSTGSTGSVSELSQGAQERWSRIHDKNLSIKDMLQVLKETSHAGKMRYQSVEEQLKETKAQRSGGNTSAPQAKQSFNSMPNPSQYSGKTLTDSQTGRKYKSDGKTWRPI